MRCSVVITTWRRANLLRACLTSLGAVHQIETIVVSDGPDDDTARLQAELGSSMPFTPRWIYLDQNSGLSAARNAGAAAATAPVIVFLDDDTTVADGWIDAHLRHHDAAGGGRIVVCGSIIEQYAAPAATTTERVLRARRERILRQVGESIAGGKDYASDIYCGLNCSIGRELFLATGGFDPRLRSSGEEMELGERLHAVGARFVFEPAARVAHDSTKNLTDTFFKSVRDTARVDVYRVRDKGQRSPQTRALCSMREGRARDRALARSAWQAADRVRRTAHALRSVAESLHSARLASTSLTLEFAADYWSTVRNEGVARAELDDLVGLPVAPLMFHQIGDLQTRGEQRHHLSEAGFARVVGLLQRLGCHFVRTDELASLPSSPRRSVSLTFDDGYEGFFSHVYPFLHERGLPASVFIVTSQIGGANAWDAGKDVASRRLLDRDQIRELHRLGAEIGAHSVTHAWLPSLSDADLRREVTESKAVLEDLLGAPVHSFAYPSGGFDMRVRAAVAEAGYRVALTTEERIERWPDPLTIGRLGVAEHNWTPALLRRLWRL